jgi:SAM-dependent methyltransferase
MAFDYKWESAIYSKSLQINKYPFDHVVSTVMRLFRDTDRRNRRVLELGCGTGNNLAFLAREGFQVHGVDGSPTAVEAAHSFLEGQGLTADLKCFDFTDLSVYDTGSFDFILDRGSVTHNSRDSIIGIISQVSRLLKDGGYFLTVMFSDKHSGCQFGVKSSDGTYSNFTDGYLEGLSFPFYFASEDDLTEFFDCNFKVCHKIHQVYTDILVDNDVRAMWSVLVQKAS